MARFFGKVGFMESVERDPGDYEEEITVRDYYGDVTRRNSRWDSVSDRENDNLNINNQISILADTYAYEHLYGIRFVDWLGIRWKVRSVEVEYPRIIINIGGVYNGDAEDEA